MGKSEFNLNRNQKEENWVKTESYCECLWKKGISNQRFHIFLESSVVVLLLGK